MNNAAARTTTALPKPRDLFTVAPRTVVTVTVLAALALAVAGSLSEVSLGDENVHVRHAEEFTRSWNRPAFDPATVKPDRRARLLFDGTPLWHMGLGALWRVFGRDAQWVAQLWQAAFYALLAVGVYVAARRLWDDSAAAWAWLIALSMPMVCAYSVVLYQDVPGVAVSALGLWLLWRRNFLWAGVALAAAYLTKMNMLSFGPWAAVLALWWAGGNWTRRLWAALAVALPVVAVFALDLAWRCRHYENGIMGPDLFPSIGMLSKSAQDALSTLPKGYVIWKPFPYYSPVSIVSHLGLLTLAGVALALVRGWDSASRWLWLGAVFCGVCFWAVFIRLDSTQIRYLFPAILLLILLAGGAMRTLRLPRWLLVALLAGCVVQGGGAAVYMATRRHVPPGELEAFDWIRANTDPAHRIMYPEELLTNRTGRATVWGALNSAYFTTDASDPVRQELLNFLSVSHIAVPKRRLYDPAVEGAHHGGYPKAFVEHIRHVPYLENVFENDAMVIFRYTRLEPIGPENPEEKPAPLAPAPQAAGPEARKSAMASAAPAAQWPGWAR